MIEKKILAYLFSGNYFNKHLLCSMRMRIVPWDEETGRYEPKLYMNITEIRQKYVHLKVNGGFTNRKSFEFYSNCQEFLFCVDSFGDQPIQ